MADTETDARRVRAHRILDAAAVLIKQWGYNKTNIEDISKAAGVGKGTIYLHWKTRDDLFRALINRERLTMALDFQQRMQAETGGVTLYSLYKQYGLALIHRPLLKALIVNDSDILGKFSQGENRTTAFAERMAGFRAYLEFLREQGLVRTDGSVTEQVFILSAIFMGFQVTAPLMPPEFVFAEEKQADLMARSIQYALESGRVPSDEEAQNITRTFLTYLADATRLAEAQFYRELDALPAGRE